MADPVSNQNPAAISNGPAAQARPQGEARAPREAENSETRTTPAEQDTLELSETGRSLSTSSAGENAGRIQSPQEALGLAQQLREQLSDNNALALAAHGNNSKAAAATLEKTA